MTHTHHSFRHWSDAEWAPGVMHPGFEHPRKRGVAKYCEIVTYDLR